MVLDGQWVVAERVFKHLTGLYMGIPASVVTQQHACTKHTCACRIPERWVITHKFLAYFKAFFLWLMLSYFTACKMPCACTKMQELSCCREKASCQTCFGIQTSSAWKYITHAEIIAVCFCKCMAQFRSRHVPSAWRQKWLVERMFQNVLYKILGDEQCWEVFKYINT